jgi:hypothetical protein
VTDRYSSPPCEQKLRGSTASLAASLDVLARRVGGEPLPVSVAVAALDLSDEQRAAVCRELRLRMGVLPDAVAVYEAEVRGRLGK